MQKALRSLTAVIAMGISLALTGCISSSTIHSKIPVTYRADAALESRPLDDRIITLSEVTYTVQPGDSLSSISAEHLGSASYWPALYADNRKVLMSPGVIYPGQVLTLPPEPYSSPPPPIEAITSSYTAGNSFQACVIERESGGNAQIWNASGHYGLYQFSYSTWFAYGGSPALFGHASAAYQTQIFRNAMDTPDGAGNWAPYDHC